MSSNTRVFPRYSTKNMKIQFIPEGMDSQDFTVDNVSLGGINISTNSPAKFNPAIKLLLKLGTQEFNLNAYIVWNKAEPVSNETKFLYGFRLVFSEENNYKRWMTFMKALHEHQKNSQP